MKEFKLRLSKKKLLKPLTAIYFFIAFVEIIAEYYRDMFYISISKPLLMPIMLGIYFCSSKKPSKYFALSLIALWIANLLFIPNTFQLINIATLFFLAYRILIIYIILRIVKFPGYIPLLLGCLPFLFMYLFVANIAYYEIAGSFTLFIIQGIFMILFGGLCLGNYIARANVQNTYLLISTMLFTAVQFILVIKVFYEYVNIFRPLAMLFFVIAQYLLSNFIVFEEKKKKRYLILNQNKEGANNSQQNDFQHT